MLASLKHKQSYHRHHHHHRIIIIIIDTSPSLCAASSTLNTIIISLRYKSSHKKVNNGLFFLCNNFHVIFMGNALMVVCGGVCVCGVLNATSHGIMCKCWRDNVLTILLLMLMPLKIEMNRGDGFLYVWSSSRPVLLERNAWKETTTTNKKKNIYKWNKL